MLPKIGDSSMKRYLPRQATRKSAAVTRRSVKIVVDATSDCENSLFVISVLSVHRTLFGLGLFPGVSDQSRQPVILVVTKVRTQSRLPFPEGFCLLR